MVKGKPHISPLSESWGRGKYHSTEPVLLQERGSLSASPTSMTLCLQGGWRAKNLQTGFPSPLCKTYSVSSTLCLRVWKCLKQLLHSSPVIVTSDNPEIQSYPHLLFYMAGTWSLSLPSPYLVKSALPGRLRRRKRTGEICVRIRCQWGRNQS